MNENFIFALAFAAILGLAGLIAFTRWLARDLRRRRRVTSVEPSPSCSEMRPASTTRRIERFSDKQGHQPEALGWPTEKSGSDSTGPENAPASAGRTAQRSEKTILIAEDDPVVAFALSRRLEQLGYRAVRSPDAMHALLGAIKIVPDLVILDVNMPSGNGLAVCEMMASDPRHAGIPVIIHSVIADDATKQRCWQLGAHHVEKSSRSWTEIRALVERLLGPGKAGKPQPPAETPPVDGGGGELPLPAAVQSVKIPSPASSSNARQPVSALSSDSPVQVHASAPVVCGRPRVLCIETPRDRLELVAHQLAGLGMEVVRTSDLEEGFWTCFTEKPHVVIVHGAATDQALPRLLDNLATHPVTRNLPVLWVNENGPGDLPPAATRCTLLKHPVDWEEMLGALAGFIPVFSRSAHDPLAKTAHPSPEADGDRCPIPDAGDRQGPTAIGEKPLKVLCVDDDPLVSRSVAMRLKPYGIEVKEADNGTGGYLLAAAQPPDLILLDMQMPNGEGNYVLGRLKDNPRTKDIPVIVLTVETAAGMRRQMLSLGAEAFVSKPVHWHDLFAEIARCVQLPRKLLLDYGIPSPGVDLTDQATASHAVCAGP